MNTRIVISAVLLPAFAGCSSALKVIPFESPKAYTAYSAARAPVYRLPETEIQVKTELKLVRLVSWKKGGDGKPVKTDKDGNPIAPSKSVLVARLSKPVIVGTVAVPSQLLAFKLNLEDYTKKGVAVEQMKLETEANGLLKGINATSADASATIVANVLSTAGNILKFAAVAGVTDTITEEEDVPDSTVPFERNYRLTQFTGQSEEMTFLIPDDQLKSIFPRDNAGKAQVPTEWPSIALELSNGARVRRLQSLLTDGPNGNTKNMDAVNGLVVGLPGTAELRAVVDGRTSERKPIPLAHLNGLQVIEIGNRKFNKRTVTITVDPSLGALTSYELKSDSAAANASKMLADSTATIKTLRDDLKTAKAAEDKRVSSADADLVEAEKRLLTAQQAVDGLKSPDPDVVAVAQLTKETNLLKAQTDLLKAKGAADEELLRLQTEKARVEAELDLLKKQKELDQAKKP